MVDEPTIFKDGEKDYAPGNYQNEYDGPMTLRRALALSRNIVTIKVAEATGYDHVADLWKKVGVGTPAKPYPSIALGVFEASPLEMATAYTLFTNDGADAAAAGDHAHRRRRQDARRCRQPPPRPIARPDTTYLVTNMMRSVINEGTAPRACAAGFTLDAAGKSGTTNDLRDAWFVGFTPELLTVVWVGFDDNQPLGLSGSQAALPIWTDVHEARAGRRDRTSPFDGAGRHRLRRRSTRTPASSRRRAARGRSREAFLAGTEPHEYVRRARRSHRARSTSSAGSVRAIIR